MRILVVDDSPAMRRLIRNSLTRIGYDDVVEARNGIEGLGKMAGVDLVLTDRDMPEMDGLALVRTIRQDKRNDNIPILIIVAEAQKMDVATALKSGANDFIVKPVSPEMLKSKIGKLNL